MVFWLGLNIPNVRQICPKITENRYLHAPMYVLTKSVYGKTLLESLKATSGLIPPIDWTKFETRNIYWKLLYNGSCSVTCIDLEPCIDWNKVWPEILCRELPSQERLLSYKIIHCALPFKCYLSEIDKRCVACGLNGADNPRHFFSQCSKYNLLRERLNVAIRGLSLSLCFNWDTVRFNGALGPDLAQKERKILRTICSVYKSVLWAERQNARGMAHYMLYKPDIVVLDDRIAWKCQEILSIK